MSFFFYLELPTVMTCGSDSDGQVIPTEAVEAAGVVGWAEDLAQQIVESLDCGGGQKC